MILKEEKHYFTSETFYEDNYFFCPFVTHCSTGKALNKEILVDMALKNTLKRLL